MKDLLMNFYLVSLALQPILIVYASVKLIDAFVKYRVRKCLREMNVRMRIRLPESGRYKGEPADVCRIPETGTVIVLIDPENRRFVEMSEATFREDGGYFHDELGECDDD